VVEAVLETKAETILQFLRGVRGSLHVTLEEGTWAAWLHDLLLPHVTRSSSWIGKVNLLVFRVNRAEPSCGSSVSPRRRVIRPISHGPVVSLE